MRSRADEASSSAARVLPLVFEALGGVPDSVVDVGCASGGWLRAFAEHGSAILGVDGSYAVDDLVIHAESFLAHDLSTPLTLKGHFDLAVSMEVIEHLPVERGEGFVADLCSLSGAVLFSGAIPQQSGAGHVNLQWQSHWRDVFAAHGYQPVDCVRPALWDDPAVGWWYRQNALLYLKGADAHLPMPLDVRHPDCVMWSPEPSLRVLTQQLPRASQQAVAARWRSLWRR
jgi:SAM-dependent methyltransferase